MAAQRPESTFFYTLHKAASTLFSGTILPRADQYIHVDYSLQLYNGVDPKKISFQPIGYIYGPLRVSSDDPESPVYELTKIVCTPEFIKSRRALFFIRDPRDILVSAYHSFGKTHGFSDVQKIREKQEALREAIGSLTIDQYVLSSAPRLRKNFETIQLLIDSSSNSAVLRYEDMIDRWDTFAVELRDWLGLKDKVLQDICRKSRPVCGQVTSGGHRRSGVPGNFRENLRLETINELNEVFTDVLRRFDYSK